MNKILLTGSLILGTSLGLAGLTQVARADTPVTTNTTADVTFVGGTLDFKDAPASISFGSHPLSADDQTYTEVDADQKATDSPLTVLDNRGQGTDNPAGWTLTAQLDKAESDGMEISLTPTGDAGTDYATFTKTSPLNATGQNVAAVAPGKISLEKPSTTFKLGAAIHIPANTPLHATKYENTIVWNLSATPA